jgi:hypothetical protein
MQVHKTLSQKYPTQKGLAKWLKWYSAYLASVMLSIEKVITIESISLIAIIAYSCGLLLVTHQTVFHGIGPFYLVCEICGHRVIHNFPLLPI